MDPLELDYPGFFDSPAVPATGESAGGWQDFLANITGTARDVFTTVKTAEAQADIIAMNKERAARGLPPLSAEFLSPQVNVGMSPATRQLVMYALIGGGAYLAFNALTKRRRR